MDKTATLLLGQTNGLHTGESVKTGVNLRHKTNFTTDSLIKFPRLILKNECRFINSVKYIL